MAWIATKEITTPRFAVLPGMTLPAKYSAKETIRQLRKTYGEDSICWIDYDAPSMRKALGGKNEGLETENLELKERNARLELQCRELEERLRQARSHSKAKSSPEVDSK